MVRILLMPQKHLLLLSIYVAGVDLTVHCKSGDSDLKEQVLPPGKSWAFSFVPNFWGTSLFYCSFKWGDEDELKWFDMYDSSRDSCLCAGSNNCWWTIQQSGPCLFYPRRACFFWNTDVYPLSLGPSSM